MKIATIGLDIAKNVFQVHVVDDEGEVVLRRKVRRDKLMALYASLEPCLVDMEACATAQHWARELTALGHEVRLMPPAYEKAYVKRNKNDIADAEVICEAVTRPTMHFVPVKSADAQSVLMLHRTQHSLVRQRTAEVSAMRAHLAEYGIVAPRGRAHVRDLIAALNDDACRLPDLARQTLLLIGGMIETLSAQIRKIEIELTAWHQTDPASQRLATIPGIGFITATALVATVSDARAFRSGRQFAAWLGLTPRQHSSGEKERKETDRRHLEDGGPLFASPAGHRRHRCRPLYTPQGNPGQHPGERAPGNPGRFMEVCDTGRGLGWVTVGNELTG